MFDFFFFQAEDGIRDRDVTGVQTCALPILSRVEAFLSDDAGEASEVARPEARVGDAAGFGYAFRKPDSSLGDIHSDDAADIGRHRHRDRATAAAGVQQLILRAGAQEMAGDALAPAATEVRFPGKEIHQGRQSY